jgi:hypothetical protein
VALQRLSRPDKSGGYAVVQYTNGVDTHRARFHFASLHAADPTLTYAAPIGAENTVFDTFAALFGIIKTQYDNTWAFSMLSAYVNAGPDPNNPGFNLFNQQFGWAPPAQQVGTGASITAAQQRALMLNFNFHTFQGGRARISLIGPGGEAYFIPQDIAPNAAGTAFQKLVAYLTGGATGVVGHDGALLTGHARLTAAYNVRLRRHYNQM